jgi:D-alanine--poly(phosphoribitol) ligase subunit 1
MNFSFSANHFIHSEIQNLKPAIIGSDLTINWLEFEKEVIKLIQIFKSINIEKGEPVIIYGHKQAHIIIAKTALYIYGGVYVPADIIFPLDRIKMMKEECKSSILINCTESKEVNDIFNVVIQLPCFEIVKQTSYIKHKLTNPLDSSNEIAYVLFTSGSTGRPKGVPISKKGVVQFADWISNSFDINNNDVLLNISSLSFDFASFDEYSMLSLGATIITTPTEVIKDSNRLIQSILDNNVTIWISTPGLVYLYLTEPRFNSEHLPLIKSFVFAGESLPLRTYQQLRLKFPNAKIWNAFGPSEATNLTTSIDITDEIIEKYNAIPIGFPKPKSKVFINNPDKEGIGEICISGDHLTPGYLNNDFLNEEKFVMINNERTYKTGDQGYSKDGLLFYNGRNDDMVKFHGYRIELEDITSALKDYPTINNASTIGLKVKGETKKIVSFYTSSNELKKESILEFIQQKLPEYMIPSEIVFIDNIPLNTSDKVDKKELERIFKER